MDNGLDLFSFPHSPGHRGISTSMEAAECIAPAAAFLRDKVLRAVTHAGHRGITVLEFCGLYGVDRMGAQPRFSELRRMQKIADSGQRRPNPSGVRAIVWSLPEHVQAPPQRAGL